jgi:hypothetical protein
MCQICAGPVIGAPLACHSGIPPAVVPVPVIGSPSRRDSPGTRLSICGTAASLGRRRERSARCPLQLPGQLVGVATVWSAPSLPSTLVIGSFTPTVSCCGKSRWPGDRGDYARIHSCTTLSTTVADGRDRPHPSTGWARRPGRSPASGDTAPVTTPTVDPCAEPVAPTDAVPTECRLCGEPLLVRRPGRDTCERHPEEPSPKSPPPSASAEAPSTATSPNRCTHDRPPTTPSRELPAARGPGRRHEMGRGTPDRTSRRLLVAADPVQTRRAQMPPARLVFSPLV